MLVWTLSIIYQLSQKLAVTYKLFMLIFHILLHTVYVHLFVLPLLLNRYAKSSEISLGNVWI